MLVLHLFHILVSSFSSNVSILFHFSIISITETVLVLVNNHNPVYTWHQYVNTNFYIHINKNMAELH